MQGRVPRGVLGSGLSPVEEQVFQVLRVTPLAGLGGGQGTQETASDSPNHRISYSLSPGKPASPSPSPSSPHSCPGAQTVDFPGHSKTQVPGLAP